MNTRKSVPNRLPHGTMWSRGVSLAEAEIGRGPEPSGRWARRSRSSGAAPEVRAFEPVETESWAALAA